MKPVLMILGLILAVGAGAVGGIMAVPRPEQPKADAYVDTRPAPAIAPSQSPELEKRLQALSLEISGLQTELAALREDRTRTPVTAASEAGKSPENLALASASPEVFAAVHRDAILKVIADERAAEAKKREDERKDRELKLNEAKADRAAQKFGLTGAQRSTLVQYYQDEQTHMEEMRAEFRNNQQQGGADGTAAREAFRAGREWRANELTRLFGTDLGAQINEFENEGRGRMAINGGGGNGGGGQRRAGGQNGGNAGPNAPSPAPGGGNN